MNRICAVCGRNAPSRRQWWNQDTGYSVCPRCFAAEVKRSGQTNAEWCYGKPGLHHSIETKAPKTGTKPPKTGTKAMKNETINIEDPARLRAALKELLPLAENARGWSQEYIRPRIEQARAALAGAPAPVPVPVPPDRAADLAAAAGRPCPQCREWQEVLIELLRSLPLPVRSVLCAKLAHIPQLWAKLTPADRAQANLILLLQGKKS